LFELPTFFQILTHIDYVAFVFAALKAAESKFKKANNVVSASDFVSSQTPIAMVAFCEHDVFRLLLKIHQKTAKGEICIPDGSGSKSSDGGGQKFDITTSFTQHLLPDKKLQPRWTYQAKMNCLNYILAKHKEIKSWATACEIATRFMAVEAVWNFFWIKLEPTAPAGWLKNRLTRPDWWPSVESQGNYIDWETVTMLCQPYNLSYVFDHLEKRVCTRKGLSTVKPKDSAEVIDHSKLEKSDDFKLFFEGLQTFFKFPVEPVARELRVTQGSAEGAITQTEFSPFSKYTRRIPDVEQVEVAQTVQTVPRNEEEDETQVTYELSTMFQWRRNWENLKLGRTEICLVKEDFFNFNNTLEKNDLGSVLAEARHPVVFADPSWGKNKDLNLMGGIDLIEEAWTEYVVFHCFVTFLHILIMFVLNFVNT